MTDYKPQPKVVGAAVAALFVALLQAFTDTDLPVGVEASLAIIAAYLIPNKS